MVLRMMRLCLLTALLIAAPIFCFAQTEKGITTVVLDPPLEVVELRPIELTIRYAVPGAMGIVPLRVELKNLQNIVLKGETANVSGEGQRHFTFTAPAVAQESHITFAVWYGTDWRAPLAPIIHTERIRIMSAEDAAKLAVQKERAQAWLAQHPQISAAKKATAILLDDLAGLDPERANRVIAALAGRGIEALPLTAEEICNRHILNADNFQTLVLSSSRVHPNDGADALGMFLRQGGNLVALETPAFTDPVGMVGGKWMDRAQAEELMGRTRAQKMLWDMESGSEQDWGYTGGPGPDAEWNLDSPGADGTSKALHCVVPSYQSWNTVIAPSIEQPFEPGQTLTCFWAKGGPQTRYIAIEWVEKDGSRWIGTVPLSQEWRHYAVSPKQLKYWHDSASQGRGGATDSFNPQNAARFTVGIAMTHTALPGGRHEFWIDQIGTAESPLGDVTLPEGFELEPVEMICPTYKFHPVTTARTVKVSDKQCILPPADLPVYPGLMSVQPRPQGTGYNKNRKWRWIPLIEAFDETGEVCGTPACLIINRTGPYAGSITASFALPAPAYENPKVLDMVAEVTRRMNAGAFLFEGGAEYYAYFQNEAVKLGARTINTETGAAPDCTARLSVQAPDAPAFEATVDAGTGECETLWEPGTFASRDYEVTCELIADNGDVIDRLTHPLVVWEPSPEPKFMDIRDGDFYLDGRKWYAHGTNYMPSSEIGIEDGEYFEFWMDSQPYDPVVTERDLKRTKAMGMNMVSIFCYYRSIGSRNLLDILERCRRHGLMVNLSLRPGTPLDFRWDEMRALIEAYRLKEHDIIFAYDLAWEPVFGNYPMRARWDGEWEKWINERYGSLANAEESWEFPVPRVDGKVAQPTDQQLSEEGPHRVMVCAYRRFLDDLLAKKHAIANSLVKSIDPNHFTSFRMSVAGDPTVGGAWIAYDFRGLARSVDIMEPEGYGRIGEWDRVRPGMFTADYSRCMAPGKPVMWAEFGNSTWNRDLMEPDPKAEEWAGGFYDRFFRMALDSGANGTINWYYPGGYRVNERSDYGIINPDGSWKPVSHSIRNWTEAMTTPRDLPPVDEWILVDRDESVKGLAGVYEAAQERYWQLREAGKRPALRTAGHGMTSDTAPRVAVGNVPYSPGRTPHKYLNAEFDRIEIRNAAGEWQEILDGAEVHVKRGDPVLVRATIGNNGDASWIAREDFGGVALTCGEANFFLPESVPSLGTISIDGFQVCELQGDMDLTFEMSVWPNTPFGEKVDFRLIAD